MKNILLTLGLMALSFTACHHEVAPGHDETAHKKAHWVYNGDMGPDHWGKISATCSEGKSQSPINIVTKDTVALKAKNIIELHETTRAVISYEVDNGHAIKITPEDDHGISIEGQHFKLLQFHYHGQSENTIDGKRFAMEMHLVHQNATGQLAVVAVMIDEGKHNLFYENVIAHVNGGPLTVATADLLPKSKKYFHFMGSLTTPPCSENVRWYVLKDSVKLDAKQIAAFRSHHDDNFRPLQPLNGRIVESN